MAECTDCSGSCQGACTGCTGCSDACTGCTGTCAGTCKGCTGTCTGTCCTGCTNACVSACSSTCNSTCKGNCFETCNTSCYASCTGQCKGYCATICQTYCQTKQTFTQNLSPIANAIGKPPFSWTHTVKSGETIKITAKEWNTLKEYITKATSYCGGTTPSGANASSDPNDINNFISASKYNDLANGLNITNVESKITLISADNIDALRTAYNDRQIINTKPAGAYTGGQGQCCQSSQTCMAEGELLEHQAKTEECANQEESSCGGQSPGS